MKKSPLTFTLIGAALALASLPAIAAEKTVDYTLHEWGTFTSVSGSDGVLLAGLQREEEGLPRFVESHAGMENRGGENHRWYSKGWSRPLSGVTIKMETPVIYFYTKQAFEAQVRVGFRGGSISQWYPQRSGGEVPPKPTMEFLQTVGGDIDFAKAPYEGSIAWDVKVTPAGEDAGGLVFKGGETMNWITPRQTDSALVSTANGDVEKYLFYRGVGNFTLPVVFTMRDNDTLAIENRGDEAIPGGIIFEALPDGTARFTPLCRISAGDRTSAKLTEFPATNDWKRAVYEELAGQLVAAGLYRKEADAMIQTWWQSYFARPGLRVFWIVPDGKTNAILPLNVTPAPAATVRVLVGRSEVLKPDFERQIVEAFAGKPEDNRLAADRFGLAYAERAKVLSAKPVKR
jgi:hypothetical protein